MWSVESIHFYSGTIDVSRIEFCENLGRRGKVSNFGIPFSDVVVMKYIGNPDGNGQKIFDGDIIAENKKGYDYIRVVGWRNEHGCWSAFHKDSPWQQIDGDEAESCKVIGNIMEDPDMVPWLNYEIERMRQIEAINEAAGKINVCKVCGEEQRGVLVAGKASADIDPEA